MNNRIQKTVLAVVLAAVCLFSSTFGMLTSVADSLLVSASAASAALKIKKQPKSVSAAKGETATVKVTASGEGLSYKWYYKNVGASKFYASSTMKSNTYTVTMNESRNGRQLYCVVTDKNGNSIKSDVVTLTLVIPLAITAQPKNVAVKDGETFAVSVGATGDGLTYKWYYKNPNQSKFYYTSTFKDSYYSTTMSASRNGRQIYCVVSDKYGNSVKSDIVTLTLATPLVITAQPQDVSAKDGETFTVSVGATGDGLTYKWYYRNPNQSKFYYTSTFKAHYYSTTMSKARSGRQVYCVITDKYGNSIQSETVTLSRHKDIPLAITTQPQNAVADDGANFAVSVTATGEGLTYKWYYKNSTDSKFRYTSTFKEHYYATTMSASRNGRQVYCVVTDKYGDSVTSDVVTLTCSTPLAITTQPQNVSAKSGKKFTVSVAATGDGLTYKWYYKNANSRVFTYTSTFTGNYYSTTMNNSRSGRRVYCVITDKYGRSVTTNIVTITEICDNCTEFNMPSLYFTEYDATKITVAELAKEDGEINLQVRFDNNGVEKLPNFEGAATLKIQGASSALKSKKNFTIKLFKDDTFGKKMKVDFGWGEESKYCMKANYVDSSHARNIIGARMYSQLVASRQYIDPKLQAAPNYGLIDGFPIAVYVNNEFHGLYTMNIPKDSWQFAMEGNETTREAMLMADQWSDSVMLYQEIGDGAFEDYGWEVEYSSTEDIDNTWIKDSFNEIIRLINCGDKEKIRAELADHLDIEAAIDNFLFVYFINAADNKAKNTIWYTYDGVVWAPSMYDMDGTFGIYYNGTVLTDDLNTYLAINADGTLKMPQSNQLHNVLLQCYAEEVTARWAFLRQEILTVENTTKHFEEFFACIPEGVFHAEDHRWPYLPNAKTNRENMYAATAAQLERLDAFFYHFKEYV